MANTHIEYVGNPAWNGLLRKAVNDFLQCREEFSHIKSIMDSMTGGGVSTANIETTNVAGFNIPVGKGDTVYTNVSNILTNLNAVGTYIYDMDESS